MIGSISMESIIDSKGLMIHNRSKASLAISVDIKEC